MKLKLISVIALFLFAAVLFIGNVEANNENDIRPGWGFGDVNHVHTGPPGQSVRVNVSGNGAFSQNSVNITSNRTTTVNQSNNAVVSNNVNTSSNTGGNSSNFNTGGSNTIVTGASSIWTSIVNFLNNNFASL